MQTQFEVGKKVKYNSEFKRLFQDRKNLNETFEIVEITECPESYPTKDISINGKDTYTMILYNEPKQKNEYPTVATLSNKEEINTYWLELIN